MTASLIQLTADIVSSHATATSMSSDDLIQEIGKVFSLLKQLEAQGSIEGGEAAAEPVITFKQAFKKDQVVCMICGKGGFKTLTRHLGKAHDLKPGQYRKQFNIPSSQALTAKNYSESRRQAANENNLAANLEKARAVRAAKKDTAKPQKAKAAAKPAKAVKAVKTVKAKTTKAKA